LAFSRRSFSADARSWQHLADASEAIKSHHPRIYQKTNLKIMNLSATLKKYLSTGDKPSSQRETSALLDEARSHLVSKLPTTATHIQNLTDGDIESILAGGKTGMMARAAAVHREKYYTTRPAAAAARPAAARPAPAPVASKPATASASAHEKYRQLQKTNPRAAAKFWEENEAKIKSQIKN